MVIRYDIMRVRISIFVGGFVTCDNYNDIGAILEAPLYDSGWHGRRGCGRRYHCTFSRAEMKAEVMKGLLM